MASGPACTAFFGALQSKANNLIIDVGGTTTDIAMIENGRPLLSEDGCTIGDWKTHIEAVDIPGQPAGGPLQKTAEHRNGIYPTDALHVLGKLRLGDRQRSLAGVFPGCS